MNALLGGGKQSGSSHGGSSNNFGGLANQVLSGLTHTGSGSQGSHGSSGGGIGGKIASQLASNLFSSGSKPATQNYHNGQQTTQYQHSGGLAGSVMGGVANMFGGGGGNSNNSVCYNQSPGRYCAGQRATGLTCTSLAQPELRLQHFRAGRGIRRARAPYFIPALSVVVPSNPTHSPGFPSTVVPHNRLECPCAIGPHVPGAPATASELLRPVTSTSTAA